MRWLIVGLLALGYTAARAEIVQDPPFDDPATYCWHDTETGLGACRYMDPMTYHRVIPGLAHD